MSEKDREKYMNLGSQVLETWARSKTKDPEYIPSILELPPQSWIIEVDGEYFQLFEDGTVVQVDSKPLTK